MNRTNRTGVNLFVVLATLLAAACANQTTSYRTERFGENGPRVITQDAKTRNVVMLPPQGPPATGTGTGTGNQPTGQWRVCAEASPDAFSALSASASADLGLNTRGAGTEAQARAAMAIAESAATIERTQTINLLRESMYRTCERYLSGAIDRATFVVQAGRDWRAMIAILAIEQLTRAARQPSTIITGGATSATLANANQILQNYNSALEEEDAAQREKAEADQMPPGTAGCATITDANRDACAARTARVAAATARLTLATQSRERWSAAAEVARQTAGTGASTTPPTLGGGDRQDQQQGGGANSGDLGDIATAVGTIVEQAFVTDETQLFCIQTLSQDNPIARVAERVPGRGSANTVQDLCLEYLAARVEADTRRLGDYRVSQPAQSAFDRRVQVIEAYLGGSPGTPGERWNLLVQPIVQHFAFGNPITVRADASGAQIRAQMRRIGDGLQQLVDRINQGGS